MKSIKNITLVSIFSILNLIFTNKNSLCQINNIYIFGDSHAISSFTTVDPKRADRWDYICNTTINNETYNFRIITNWLGSITMHRVGRDGLQLIDLKKYPINEGDSVIFVFGEIDVRCHIGKQRDIQKRNLEEIIETLTKNYLNSINLNKKTLKNLNTFILSIMPPTNQVFNEHVPYYGSLEDRINITKKLNEKLSILAKENNIIFIDAYSLLSTQKGDLRYDISDKNVHLDLKYNYLIKDIIFQKIIEINNTKSN